LNTEAFLQDNRLWDGLLVGSAVIILTLLLKAIFHFVILKLQKLGEKTGSNGVNMILYALAGTKVWAIFIWLSVLALPLLKLHDSVNQVGRRIAILASAIQIMIWGLRAINHWRRNFLEKKIETDTSSIAAIGLLGTALQAMLVVTVILLALSNLGIDVGALIAGLGIGGIAVALAAQNILGDLLASLSIVLDKPFVVGDFIVVGDKAGTVEHIGIKTTRLKALSGEQLVFSNKNLLESLIQNFKRMRERRAIVRVGVVYSTPREKLEQIPGWLKGFIEKDPGLRFDRAHFSGFGASSLDFEMVFFVLSSQYADFMDRQQVLLLSIFSKFAEEGIDFAFPSTSVYVEKMPKKTPEGSPEFLNSQVSAPPQSNL